MTPPEPMGFLRAAYSMAVGSWGIQPSEFWGMDLSHWTWVYEVRRPPRTQKWAGTLTDADVVALSKALDEAERNGKN